MDEEEIEKHPNGRFSKGGPPPHVILFDENEIITPQAEKPV